MKKKLIVGLLSALMITSSVSTYAAQAIQIVIDDKVIETDVAPELKNNTTYVPISFIAKELGANVKWESPKVIIEKEDITLEFEIGIFTMLRDEEKYPLTQAPYLLNGRTMVPLRVISEHLGCQVGYDNTNKIVSITSGVGVPLAPAIDYSDYKLSPNQKWGRKVEERYVDKDDPIGLRVQSARIRTIYILNTETKDIKKIYEENVIDYKWTIDNQLIVSCFDPSNKGSYYRYELYNPETDEIVQITKEKFYQLLQEPNTL